MVKVFGAGSTLLQTTQFSASQLAQFPDQEGGNYEVRPGPGSGPVPPGVPIRELIQQAGPDPAGVKYVDVIGSTPYRSLLSSATRDFDPPASNEFVNGLQPVFYPVGDSLGYVRPLHADDPGDSNADDLLQVTRGGAFTVEIYTSSDIVLRPTLTANTTGVRVGAAVRLSATVADPVHETLSWSFHLADGNDIDTGATPTITHTYAAPGTYYVQASVTGSNGTRGESNTVPITVRSRSQTPRPPKTTGPGRGAGSTSNPVGGPATGTGSRYNGRPTTSPDGSGGATSNASRPSPEPSALIPSALIPSAPSAPVSGAPAPGSTAATSRAQVTRPSGGQQVVGFALFDPTGAGPRVSSAAASSAAAAAARTGGPSSRASLGWLGATGILVLLLAGAGLERRGSTPASKRRRR